MYNFQTKNEAFFSFPPRRGNRENFHSSSLNHEYFYFLLVSPLFLHSSLHAILFCRWTLANSRSPHHREHYKFFFGASNPHSPTAAASERPVPVFPKAVDERSATYNFNVRLLVEVRVWSPGVAAIRPPKRDCSKSGLSSEASAKL